MTETTDSRLFDAFDDCLSRLMRGESLDDCLSQYPDQSVDLRPMLEAARAAVLASRVPPPVQMLSRARFLAAAAQKQPSRSTALFGLVRRALTTALTLIVGFALGATGLYYASADTLPGDELYTLKRTIEDVRLEYAGSPANRYTLEEEFGERRKSEAQALLVQGRMAVVNFSDILISRQSSMWQVGGFTLEVTEATEIVGDPPPGFYVAVTAELHEGQLTAVTIVSQEEEIAGQLIPAGAGWSIRDKTFVIVPETMVRGTIEAGATAVARLRRMRSGDVVAVSLTILAPLTATPPPPTSTGVQPSPTPHPQVPSGDGQVLNSPTLPPPTRTLQPSPTPRPTDTLQPGRTQEAIGTGEPDETDEPPETEEPDDHDGDGNRGPGGGHSGPGGGGGGGGDDDGGDG